MPSTHEILRERLLLRAGLATPPAPRRRLADLEKTEWVPRFEQFMRNRLIMGALRYGTIAEKRRSGNQWDFTGALERKCALYRETGNMELLVDIANYCMLEFDHGHHPNRHFSATDDEDHCKLKSKQ